MAQNFSDSPKCFIIAEAGVNHNGDLDTARRLVDIAANAGADAVKFQTFKANKLVTKTAQKAEYQKETTGSEESQYEMLRRLELPEAHHHELIKHCKNQNILFLSTPFDEESADFLEDLGMTQFKIGSGELTNLPFLKHVARKGRPVILSTGMSWLSEVEEAVRAIEETGHQELSLLHCVSQYPAAYADTNLRAMKTLQQAFGYPVGFSDHTPGIEIPIAAVALGATIIEKHFTLDRTMEGPDHRASLEAEELAAMIRGIRHVESALGDGLKRPTSAELELAKVGRKSIVAGRHIEAGERLTSDMLTTRRPGTGLSPQLLSMILGRTTAVEIHSGEVLELSMLH